MTGPNVRTPSSSISGGNGAIDWNTELRKIEREYDGLPSHTQLRLQKVEELKARDRLEEQLEIVGVWVRLLLLAALTTGLFWWPYGLNCGWRLATFLGAHSVVVTAGLLLAIKAWRTRQGLVFSGAAFFALVAWTVLAVQVVPRLRLSVGSPPSVSWVCRS